ncbi:MAG: zinc dependent phospholipase C family protein [Candidatus Pristimantibacillus sp.]
MPNVWTHFIFGQIVLDKLGEQDLIHLDKQRRIFNMGCQGPDFLLYHRFLPWMRKSAMNRLGTEMHQINCGPVIMELLDSVKGRSAEVVQTDPSIIYAIGFVLHHVLDRHLHPFVFSRSGFCKWDHQRYEIMIDTLIARKLRGIETWKTPVWKEIAIGGPLPAPILDAFQLIARNHYPELASQIRREDWNAANRDMIRAQRLFHDPTGIKRALTIGQIEPFVFHREVLFDVLNEANLPWIDPTDKQIDHHDNAWTLWDQAMSDSISILRTILEWLRNTSNDLLSIEKQLELRQSIEEQIGNFSYDSGLPCDSGASIRYSDPIWPGVNKKEAPLTY